MVAWIEASGLLCFTAGYLAASQKGPGQVWAVVKWLRGRRPAALAGPARASGAGARARVGVRAEVAEQAPLHLLMHHPGSGTFFKI